MGMTMTQKILAAHAGLDSVKAGQLIEAKLDLVLGNDSFVGGKVTTDSRELHSSYSLEEKKKGFSGSIGSEASLLDMENQKVS